MVEAIGSAVQVRLDVWLDVACLFKTRSEAQKACKGGKVEVNGVRAKPHKEVRIGDELAITRPLGRRQKVVVKRIAERHLPKADARALYEDVSPPPSAEERALRDLARGIPAFRAMRSPDKRHRRLLRRLKGREG